MNGDDQNGEEQLGGWEDVGNRLRSGDLAGARMILEGICRDTPDLAEAWINLGSVERELNELKSAAEHLDKGVTLLSARPGVPDPLLLPAWLSLAEIYELLEDIPLAEKALRQAFKRAPEMASSLIQLAGLKARSGDLAGAKAAAKEYCMAAVSILTEKASIGLVRKFQKALDEAASVDGRLLLVATREAAAMAFDNALNALKSKSEGIDFKTEPVQTSGTGSDPFLMKRADAMNTVSLEMKELLSEPIYGFPGNCPAAKDVLFTVPASIGADFPVLVCTRTAWNKMQIRIRLRNSSNPEAVEKVSEVVTEWFKKGFAGAFSDGSGRGFFHSIERPVHVGGSEKKGIRFDMDLGLSFQRAIDALVNDLNQLNKTTPIEELVFGDGLLS